MGELSTEEVWRRAINWQLLGDRSLCALVYYLSCAPMEIVKWTNCYTYIMCNGRRAELEKQYVHLKDSR